MTPNDNTPALLWPRPPQHTLSVAAHQARWRFVERERVEPVAIVLNPCHQAELQPPFVGDRPTLAGLLVKFDPMIRPSHLLVLAADPDEESAVAVGEPVLSQAEGQQNSRHAPVPATKLSSPQPKGVNQ